jgi:hypothetical protein
MSHETNEKPNYLVERIESPISLPALQLFTDPQKFDFYVDFMQKYAGEPHKSLPKLERDRGGGLVEYDGTLISAMTDDGSHFVHIRRGHSQHRHGLEPVLQYFPVTADFETFDISELWVNGVNANNSGEPTRLELILSHQPVHEVETPFEVSDELSLLQRATARALYKIALARRTSNAIRFVHENKRSYFTWGNGSPMQTLHSSADIQNDLILLQYAEQQGLLDREVRSHQAIRDYLARAA